MRLSAYSARSNFQELPILTGWILQGGYFGNLVWGRAGGKEKSGNKKGVKN